MTQIDITALENARDYLYQIGRMGEGSSLHHALTLIEASQSVAYTLNKIVATIPIGDVLEATRTVGSLIEYFERKVRDDTPAKIADWLALQHNDWRTIAQAIRNGDWKAP